MKLFKQLLFIIVLLLCVAWYFNSRPAPAPRTTPVAPVTPVTPIVPFVDPRVAKLETFFDRHNCPQPNYASDYLQAADQTGLDYRLLPSISVLESACGRHTAAGSNNWWGWDSGKTKFTSVRQGIYYISFMLTSYPYWDNPLEQKLHYYNSVNPNYTQIIKGLMAQINQQP